MKNKIKKFFDKIKAIFRKFISYLKRPTFFIPFAITWILLESPMIFGLIMYFFTKQNMYWQIAAGWFALTAPALPIPVIPISTAVAVAVERLIHKIKEKKDNGRSSSKID